MLDPATIPFLLSYRVLFVALTTRTASKDLQTALRDAGLYTGVVDGVWGPRTEGACLSAASIAWASLCIRWGHHYLPVAEHPTLSRLRTRTPRGTLYHWPGGTETAEVLGNVWRRNQQRNTDADLDNDKHVSSNWGCDEHRVVWYAAPHFVTYHAGTANGEWVGGDLCVPVLPKHEANARGRGVFVGYADHYHIRDALDLDPRIADHAVECHRMLEDALGTPLEWTDHAAVDPSRKWDCEPWRKRLDAASRTPGVFVGVR